MKTVTITCDKCGEPIKDSVCGLVYTGPLGHNQIPTEGWHFHYKCLSQVVDVILKTFVTTNSESKVTP